MEKDKQNPITEQVSIETWENVLDLAPVIKRIQLLVNVDVLTLHEKLTKDGLFERTFGDVETFVESFERLRQRMITSSIDNPSLGCSNILDFLFTLFGTKPPAGAGISHQVYFVFSARNSLEEHKKELELAQAKLKECQDWEIASIADVEKLTEELARVKTVKAQEDLQRKVLIEKLEQDKQALKDELESRPEYIALKKEVNETKRRWEDADDLERTYRRSSSSSDNVSDLERKYDELEAQLRMVFKADFDAIDMKQKEIDLHKAEINNNSVITETAQKLKEAQAAIPIARQGVEDAQELIRKTEGNISIDKSWIRVHRKGITEIVRPGNVINP